MNQERYKKSDLPEGPWHNEPDRVEFEHQGFPCLANRNALLTWCGYVAVPRGHPLWEVDFPSCSKKKTCKTYCKHSPEAMLEVHGGLTYAGHCQGEICHVPKPGEPDDVWWFGFDCGHAFDLTPGFLTLEKTIPGFKYSMLEHETYRDLVFVKGEIRRLANQLRAMAIKTLDGPLL